MHIADFSVGHARRQRHRRRRAADRDRRGAGRAAATAGARSPSASSATARPTQGAFHESLNITALWKLPVVYVCENNRLRGRHTDRRARMATSDVATRATPTACPASSVDGNDVLAVREAAARAVERARAGDGPTLLECKTFAGASHALRGRHHTGDAAGHGGRRLGRPRPDRAVRAAGCASSGAVTPAEMPRLAGRARPGPRSTSPRPARSQRRTRRSTTCSPTSEAWRSRDARDHVPARRSKRRWPRRCGATQRVYTMATASSGPLLAEFGPTGYARRRSPRRR